MTRSYQKEQLSREEINALSGVAVVQFGTDWCGFCTAAEPHIQKGLEGINIDHHLKVEDGPGRPLGRSFKVKLWPTLIFLKNGEEISRVVRPQGQDEVRNEIEKLLAD